MKIVYVQILPTPRNQSAKQNNSGTNLLHLLDAYWLKISVLNPLCDCEGVCAFDEFIPMDVWSDQVVES